MSYVTQDYYENIFKGELVADTDFPSLLLRAEEIIEEMTVYRLNNITFLAMPEDIQERVKKAICAQIEYLDANGGSDMDNSEGLQSASLGKFSYSKSGANIGSAQTRYAPRALRNLAPTGLLNRGGGCY